MSPWFTSVKFGEGPWHNAKNLLITANLESSHYDNSNICYE